MESDVWLIEAILDCFLRGRVGWMVEVLVSDWMETVNGAAGCD